MGQDEVPLRRRWSAADRRAAVELAFGEDGDVSAVAASLGVGPKRIQAWRRRMEATEAELQSGSDPLFVPAVVADEELMSDDRLSAGSAVCGTISVSFDDVRIRLGRDAQPAVVSALITALRAFR